MRVLSSVNMAAPSAQQAAGQDGANTNTTVAFLGPVNSYSHQATKTAFPEAKWHLEPTTTIKEIFDLVQSRHAPYGVVPFENSTHGTVTFTLDNLADRAGEYADLSVCDEVYLDVHHFLLGRLPPSTTTVTTATTTTTQPTISKQTAEEEEEEPPQNGVPLHPLTHIRRIYSHPQAFGQTAAFVRRHLPAAETVEVSSTSRAAELAAEDASGASAAIASEMAGRAVGLDVLARWVEDREDNATRFFILRRGVDEGGEGEGGGEGEEVGEGGGVKDGEGDEDVYGGGKYKSLVSFTVPHRRPGALADALACFGGRGLNLTSISSVPSLVGPFQYLFFVEFEGSRFDDPEGRVSGVFGDLERVAERWRWLGSWRNRRGGR
ncbi:Prephenate dehydratase-domain-containing protein [Chaetomium fimeti]|uniref:prephenate dehydratase n=1 Tax=Chaetomium fimeti TaxID=1854472 RepID=A0AAE0HG52_9PEZI|nr:Prephenate dehydratase-domain-containing protein [Chaetomium fimeti]